jgi:2-keto-4-pentenoate hydratase
MAEPKLWNDPRVARGMRAQLERRRQRLAAGDQALGWKVGFAAPAMLKQLDISGPLVGFLTQSARVDPGGRASLRGWAKPVAEPEIAVHLGRDVPAGSDRAAAAAAISGISPAFELVDIHEPPQDPERVLVGNIYQRHVVLAATGPARSGASADGLTCRIIRRGQESARTADPQANTGQWVEIVRHVADVLAAFDTTLRAGEVIITGSVVAPLALDPDETEIAFAVEPIGGVVVRFER